MLVVAQSPPGREADERENCPPSALGTFVANTEVGIDQPKQSWQHEACNEYSPNHRICDENDVPRIPLLGKWPERPYAVVVGEIEQDVADSGDVSKKEEPSPAWRALGIFDRLPAQIPDQVNETDYNSRHDRRAEK